MAIEHPEFEVTGIDMADMFPATIRPENVKFEICDIMAGLPYPDNSFDFIHMRLMIVALRGNEWPLVLKEAYRVLKPGGIIGLVESDFTVCISIFSLEIVIIFIYGVFYLGKDG